MISRFSSIIGPIIAMRKIDLLSSQKSTISSLERELDLKKNDEAVKKAMDFLQGAFGAKMNGDDYRKIKHELNLNLMNKA